jgi:O-antigen/teichoic acid export membrane protein
VLANFLVLATGDGLTRLLAAVGWIYLARTLGREGYGVLEFALGLFTYAQLLAGAGLDLAGMRMIAQGMPAEEAVGELTPLRVMCAVAVNGPLLIVASLLPQPGVGVLLACYGLVLFPISASLRWALLGEERVRAVSAAATLGQLGFLGMLALWIHGPDQVRLVPWLLAICEGLVAIVVAVAFVRAGHRLRLRWRPHRWPGLLAQSLWIGGAQLIGQIIYNADVVLLGFLGWLGQVGYYSAAYRVALLAQVVPTAYFTAIFPSLARTYSGGARELPRSDLPALTIYYSLAISIPACLWITQSADSIVGFVYGTDFSPAAPVLRVLAWSAPLVTVRALFRSLLVSSHQESTHLLFTAFTAATNVALNLLLIPRFGIAGAAIVTLACEALLLAFSIAQVRASLGPLQLVRPACAALVAAGVMTLALLLGMHIVGATILYVIALRAARLLWTRSMPTPTSASSSA